MGHEVTVLTTVKERQANSLNLDCSGFTVIETPLWMPFWKAYRAVKVSEKDAAGNPAENPEKTIKAKILLTMKNWYMKFSTRTGCFFACRFPDWHDRWIKKAASQLRPTCCDLLVTTGGPYSVHRTAILLKQKGWKGKWILDWRDLWTKNHLYPGLRIFHPWERHLERLFHENADYITTVSDPLAETLRSMTDTPVATIYNGFDPEDFEFLFARERKSYAAYTISYLGTIYRGYLDPEPLFQGLGELDRTGLITPDDIAVQFAGAQSDVLDMAQKHGVAKYYSYLGFLPREKALELEYDSDAVLFLEYEDPKANIKGVLTGKIFEYLCVARTVLCIGLGDQASAGSLIKEAKAGMCFEKDVERIKAYLLEAVKDKKAGKSRVGEKSLEVIERFNRKTQAERMLGLVL